MHDPLIRRGVLLDLGATGWMPALPAIQAAAAENSLKLGCLAWPWPNKLEIHVRPWMPWTHSCDALRPLR